MSKLLSEKEFVFIMKKMTIPRPSEFLAKIEFNKDVCTIIDWVVLIGLSTFLLGAVLSIVYIVAYDFKNWSKD